MLLCTANCCPVLGLDAAPLQLLGSNNSDFPIFWSGFIRRPTQLMRFDFQYFRPFSGLTVQYFVLISGCMICLTILPNYPKYCTRSGQRTTTRVRFSQWCTSGIVTCQLREHKPLPTASQNPCNPKCRTLVFFRGSRFLFFELWAFPESATLARSTSHIVALKIIWTERMMGAYDSNSADDHKTCKYEDQMMTPSWI